MTTRNLSLTPRVEGVRNTIRITTPVHFTTNEIKDHFNESLDSIKSQFEVAEQLKSSNNVAGYQTVLRSQVVLVEGLLDFYIHEMSKYCMFQMFCQNWEKSDKYDSFMVPMVCVEQALASTESYEWFFEYLNNRFSRDVFLSVESMRDQLNLIGIGFVPTMVKAFPANKDEESKKLGTNIVRDLFKRRNEIAHQNDRSHASAKQTSITKEYVEDYIHNVESIVNAIQTIVEDKESTL